MGPIEQIARQEARARRQAKRERRKADKEESRRRQDDVRQRTALINEIVEGALQKIHRVWFDERRPADIYTYTHRWGLLKTAAWCVGYANIDERQRTEYYLTSQGKLAVKTWYIRSKNAALRLRGYPPSYTAVLRRFEALKILANNNRSFARILASVVVDYVYDPRMTPEMANVLRVDIPGQGDVTSTRHHYRKLREDLID